MKNLMLSSSLVEVLAVVGAILVGFNQEDWENALVPVRKALELQGQDAEYVKWIKERYGAIADTLEHGAELLQDMKAFRKETNGAFVQGYYRQLENSHTSAQYRAEKFLSSLDDCRCDAKLKTRGLSGDDWRRAHSKWMREAATEIRRILGEVSDIAFWKKRSPV